MFPCSFVRYYMMVFVIVSRSNPLRHTVQSVQGLFVRQTLRHIRVRRMCGIFQSEYNLFSCVMLFIGHEKQNVTTDILFNRQIVE